MSNFYENPNLQKEANKIVTEGGQFPTRKEAIQGINKTKKSGLSNFPSNYAEEEKFYASEEYQNMVFPHSGKVILIRQN